MRLYKPAQSPQRLLRQGGQALPLGLAFALVGMLGALVLFNTGQVAVDKQRLANTADSAAYSGMVWQARALNFQAYSNRAMVANQVSIGQAVSLHSWADYAEQTGQNAETVLGWIPYVGQFVSAMAEIISVIAGITRPIAEGMVAVIGPINKAIGIAQEAMYASSFAATPDIVRDVAKASDDRFTADTAYSAVGLGQNLKGWSEFTRKYDDEDLVDMGERTKVINDSRDDFSRDRYWDFFDNFWAYSTPFTKHKVFREGESRLVMKNGGDDGPQWEWMAKDTVALHTKVWRGWRGTKNYEIPMGWGAAYANDADESSFIMSGCRSGQLRGEPCRYRNRNKTTESIANGFIESLDNYIGVTAFRSISESVREPEEDEPVLRLKTEVSMDIEDVKSSNEIVTNQDPFATPMVSPANKISSISVAEVYYRRPEAYLATTSEEKSLEPANGYNPYWDVRLAPVDTTERLLALGLRGDLGSTSTLPGGAAAEALANYESQAASEGEGGDTQDGGQASDSTNGQGPGSSLPSYEGATLASAMGVSDSRVDALVAANNNPGKFIESSIDGYMSEDDIKGMIEEEIKGQVQEAAMNLLTSAFKSAVDDMAPGVIDKVEQAQDVAEEAIAVTEELSENFENLREQVQAEFQEALESKVQEYEEELKPLFTALGVAEAELADIENQINAAENVGADLLAERDRLLGVVEDTKLEVEELYGVLRNELTNYLIDRIEYHGRGFLNDRMPFNEMQEVTEFLLRDYLETPVEERGEIDVNEQLPWAQDDNV